ncbi:MULTISPECIES: hypothetical protein [Phaeobacter]|uniref:hypothetical protein n=1 Tax=Phaeobacter TaxID=302485 RepID=UPI003A8BEE03
MRLVKTRRAKIQTELSTEQLRDWSSRRAFIPADIQNSGRGSPAQFGWQAIPLLRIALQLKDRFHVEFHARRRLFAVLREALHDTSFVKLWGTSVAVYDCESWEVLNADSVDQMATDAIIVHLDSHLAASATKFAMPSLPPTAQLELFPPRSVLTELAPKGDETAAAAHKQQLRGWA